MRPLHKNSPRGSGRVAASTDHLQMFDLHFSDTKADDERASLVLADAKVDSVYIRQHTILVPFSRRCAQYVREHRMVSAEGQAAHIIQDEGHGLFSCERRPACAQTRFHNLSLSVLPRRNNADAIG